MKTSFSLLLLIAVPLIASAQNATPGKPSTGPAPAAASAADLATLERFLALSEDELAQMESAIARVRAMTPAQRAALREQIVTYRQLPEPQRMQIRQGWGWMPPEIQNAWREMMQNATADEHAAIQSKMQSLSPEEKMRYRRGLAEAYLKAKAQKK